MLSLSHHRTRHQHPHRLFAIAINRLPMLIIITMIVGIASKQLHHLPRQHNHSTIIFPSPWASPWSASITTPSPSLSQAMYRHFIIIIAIITLTTTHLTATINISFILTTTHTRASGASSATSMDIMAIAAVSSSVLQHHPEEHHETRVVSFAPLAVVRAAAGAQGPTLKHFQCHSNLNHQRRSAQGRRLWIVYRRCLILKIRW